MRTQEEIISNPRISSNVEECAPGLYRAEIAMPGWKGSVVWDSIADYEHVSIAPYRSNLIASWYDMCRLKDIFWREDEEVYQIHPAKTDYVNVKENCLHLWRHKTITLPKEGR